MVPILAVLAHRGQRLLRAVATTTTFSEEEGAAETLFLLP